MNSSNRLVLTSVQNQTVRRLVGLRDNRRQRQAGRFLVDGWRETRRAIDSGLAPLAVYVDEDLPSTAGERSTYLKEAESAYHDDVQSTLAAAPNVCAVSEAVMQRISYGQKSRGVVAEFEQPTLSLTDLRLPNNPFVLVLDSIEKPGNVGAVFRSADAAGVAAIILTGSSTPPFSPNTIRSSLGTVFTVPTALGPRNEVESYLRQQGLRILAARVESSAILWDVDLTGAVAVVLGSESQGLAGQWKGTVESPIAGIRIPMNGVADSLNLSVSAAIIAFEATRRKAIDPLD